LISGKHEFRSVKRDSLVEILAKELPQDAIRYSSKVVFIEEDGDLKLLHLADGSKVKAKVRNNMFYNRFSWLKYMYNKEKE
jgi:hypothetical protein